MKATCQTNRVGFCQQCGGHVTAIQTCPAWLAKMAGDGFEATATPDECPHLLDPTGESVKVFGCGCASSSKHGVLTTVFECEVYGRCVPFPKGTHLETNTIKRCVNCSIMKGKSNGK